ncbi:MAG TPA: holo-ACP synthase [Gammaproteobacteria bacterium]|nr:holo-ACP synthase [Gammaproteobacteria bacterium]
MIFGIGTDIVRVDRMQKNIERHGERFAERILTATELVEFRTEARPAHFLAKRFAAKEAAAKAMGTGFRDGLMLHHIGVTHDQAGKPQLAFTDQAEEFIRRHGITSVHVSLADEQDHAVAFVTLATD